MEKDLNRSEELLDEAIRAVREEAVGSAIVAEARHRVWRSIQQEALNPEIRLGADRIAGCSGFQELIPDYLAGSLTAGQSLLVENHTHQCVQCRKVLLAARNSGATTGEILPLPYRRTEMRRYATAAALLVGVGLGSWYIYGQFGWGQAGPQAVLASSEGQVYKLSGGTLRPVSTGAEISDRDSLRTGVGGRAMVRLNDGSLVEVNERAEFSVSTRRNDTTVHLEYGNVIVQAAKRSSGHLYVASDDCRVAVTGTVFSVNHGTKGSRVSVIEGQVSVEYGGKNTVLEPGEQTATNPSVGTRPLREEIAWSRNLQQHLALLRDLSVLKKKLDGTEMPGLRYGSRFLDSVPDGTTIYVSLPNLGHAVTEVQRLIEEQTRDSAVFRRWSEQTKAGLPEMLARVQRFSAYLGDEVTLAFQPCAGFCGVLIADAQRPGLREALQTEMAKLGNPPGDPPLQVVEGSNMPRAKKGQLLVAFRGSRIVMGEQPQFVRAAANGGTRFAASGFGKRIGEVFARGAGIVVAADLQHLIESHGTSAGLNEMRYLVAEHKSGAASSRYSAVLNFASGRKGIASWLGAPSAMAGLSFISSEAQAVTAIVFKRPAEMLDDLADLLRGKQQDSRGELAVIEEQIGVDVRNEIASTLGGEVTFALDGPVLPLPSWKLVAEVNQPAALQAAIEKMVASANEKLARTGDVRLRLSHEEESSRTWYTLDIGTGSNTVALHYLYADGYLVGAMSRGRVG